MSENTELSAPSHGRLALLAKNAAANLVRAVSTSAVTVLLPLILVVVFNPQGYAAWALIFSIGAYVNYLDLGIPTSVQAIVGRAIAVDAHRTARRAALSGVATVSIIAALCLIASTVVGTQMSAIFPAMPAQLAAQSVYALPLIVLGQVSVLIGNAGASYFGGQQRSHVSMFVLTPARLLSVVAAVAGAVATHDLIVTALGFAVPLALGTIVLVGAVLWDGRRATDAVPGAAERTSIFRVLAYSGPLMVWGLCMLVTTGVGIAIVGRFDYAAVVPFSVASIFASALAGAQSSLMTPWLPELARTLTLSGPQRVSSQAAKLSTLNAVFLFGAVAFLAGTAPWFLPILTKRPISDLPGDWLIFAILLTGSAVHLVGTPVTLAFIATKTHTKIIAPPIAEAIVSLALNIWFGSAIGAVGVSTATVIASSVGIFLCFTWSLRLSGILTLRPAALLTHSLAAPLLAALPALLTALAIVLTGTRGQWYAVVLIVLAGLATAVLLFRFALSPDVRTWIASRFGRGRLSHA